MINRLLCRILNDFPNKTDILTNIVIIGDNTVIRFICVLLRKSFKIFEINLLIIGNICIIGIILKYALITFDFFGI
jgi:hypothetical protein